jgi:uncharacterized protein DUF6958
MTAAKKTIRGKRWEKPRRASLDKYTMISTAILHVLTSERISFSNLVERVRREVPDFPGSVAWYTVASLRGLERERKVARTKGRTVTYHKL